MEEERIKSALEIAMERISSLPELTPEEIAVQKEKQFGPVGEAIAGRYMCGLTADDALPAELEKYRPDQRQIVRHGLIAQLCRTLQLEGDPAAVERALNGLSRIAPGKELWIAKASQEFQAILQDYGREKRDRSAAIEASALHPLGISGTAVRCNPAENAHWRIELEKMRRSFEPRLEGLRATIQSELFAS